MSGLEKSIKTTFFKKPSRARPLVIEKFIVIKAFYLTCYNPLSSEYEIASTE